MNANIAIVLPTLHPAGAERVALVLAREIAAAGMRVAIVTYADNHPSRIEEHSDWSRLVPAGCAHYHLQVRSGRILAHVQRALALRRLLRQLRPEGVLSVLLYSNVLVAAVRKTWLLPPFRHVASEHNVRSAAIATGGRAQLLQAKALKWLAYSSRIVCVSWSVASALRQGSFVRPNQDLQVIYNPVEVGLIRELAAHPVGIALPPVEYVATVGRLTRIKRHDVVLRALALTPGLHLVVVGDGPERSRLEQLASELNIRERVHFAGWLDSPYPLMARARAVVLASDSEGFGLVAVESACVGTTFIGSASDGLREVCELLGMPTFPPGDSAALADLLSDLPRAHPPQDAVFRLFDAKLCAQAYVRALYSKTPTRRASRFSRERRRDRGMARPELEPEGNNVSVRPSHRQHGKY